MIEYGIVFLLGGITFLLIARVNPWLKKLVYGVADKIEEKIEEKTGKDI